jgi:putative transposase
VIAFIDGHRDNQTDGLKWGVEPICEVLQFAPSTYHDNKTRPPSARAVLDQQLKPLIEKVFDDNYRVYGAEKIWEQLLRDGVQVARCTVERLMKELGIEGARRGKAFVITTESDPLAERPKDFVKRKFSASAPNRLWVADLTYVRTLAGWVYVAFVIDVFSRKFIGWKVSTSLHADIALDALEMAFRGRNNCEGVVHHSDRGVQYLSIRYSERLAEAQVIASVGTKGDSYDNALMESHNGLYKWELINRRDDWRDADHVEWETLCYIDWFNNRRLHGANGMVPPVELEEAYYRVINSADMLVSQ